MPNCDTKITIPELTCPPQLSISRIPVELAGGLDTTDLAKEYGFTEADLLREGIKQVSTVTGESIDDPDICAVGDTVTDDNDLYISYLDSALELAGDRGWITGLPCDNGELPVALFGPVGFTDRRTGSFSMPTFVPRASGSRKPDEPTTDDDVCGPDAVTITVVNKSDKTLKKGTAVTFDNRVYDVPTDEEDPSKTVTCAGVIGYTNDFYSWGVLTADCEPGDIGCCVVSGAAWVSLAPYGISYPLAVPRSADGVFETNELYGVPKLGYRRATDENALTSHEALILVRQYPNRRIPFLVLDSSLEAGKAQIKVIDGTTMGRGSSAGTYHGRAVSEATFNIPAEGKYYVNLIDYKLYLLTQRFDSNIVQSCELIAEVTYENDKLTILQRYLGGESQTAVGLPSCFGDFSYTLNMASNKITSITIDCPVTAQVNWSTVSHRFQLDLTTGNTLLRVGLDRLVLPHNESPVVVWAPPESDLISAEVTQTLAQFSVTISDAQCSFNLVNRREWSNQLFTFTRLYLDNDTL